MKSGPLAHIRRVHINDRPRNRKFCNNTKKSTKYRWWSFVPYALAEQFALAMNQYFLLLALLQLWKEITPINPLATWIPLIVVVGVGMVREWVDDAFRWRRDRASNNKQCRVLSAENGHLRTLPSWKVRVGDVLYVEENEEIRADMVLLKSSNEDGVALVETAAVDGEKDYKSREAVREVHQRYDMHTIHALRGVLDCPLPDAKIEQFDATMHMDDSDGTAVASLRASNLLLQDTTLKNTRWCYGIVVYTGHDTKISRNGQSVKFKWSSMDIFINRVVIIIFLIQMCCWLALGTSGNFLEEKLYFQHGYLSLHEYGKKQWWQYVIYPLRFLLLCSLMIPQSLKVTQDVSKYIISSQISRDLGMYDEKSDTPAIVSNTNLCEELGKIQMVFTDKTGTMTENRMEFKSCIIGSNVFDNTSTESQEHLKRLLSSRSSETLNFFRAIALCNSATVTSDANGNASIQSSSPDEEALLAFSKTCGVELKHRDRQSVTISVLGQIEKYDVLNELEFSSARRCMSIIVRHAESSCIRLYTKGADDIVISAMVQSQRSLIRKARLDIQRIAMKGLRTLVVAEKELSEEEYNVWKEEHVRASCALEDRETMVRNAYQNMESGLYFIGATGIEDALQDDVPETIEALRAADISVWMITGDKLETAVQVGYASKLITMHTTLAYLAPSNRSNACSFHDALLERLQTSFYEGNMPDKQDNVCCVVEGSILDAILADNTLKKYFMKLVPKCRSFICCRMTPRQKSTVVRLIKREQSICTLAIGDGGNDVSMVLEAHIGVGISGREGLAAVRAADFGIAQFKFLRRLLLVHGYNFHTKMSTIVHYTLYKSLMIAFIQLLFSTVSAFSGAPVLGSFILTTYNLCFTALIPVAFIFNRNASDRALEKLPSLYRYTQSGQGMTIGTIFICFLYALFQAILFGGGSYLYFGQNFFFNTGYAMDHAFFGLILLTAIMCTQMITAVLTLREYSWFNMLFVVGSFLAFLIMTLGYSFLNIYDHLFMAFPFLLINPTILLGVLVMVTAANMPMILVCTIRHLWASPRHNAIEWVRKKETKERHRTGIASNSRIHLKDSFYAKLRQRLMNDSNSSSTLQYHRIEYSSLNMAPDEQIADEGDLEWSTLSGLHANEAYGSLTSPMDWRSDKGSYLQSDEDKHYF